VCQYILHFLLRTLCVSFQNIPNILQQPLCDNFHSEHPLLQLNTLSYSFHNILLYVLLHTLSYTFHNTLYVLLHTLSYSFHNILYVLLNTLSYTFHNTLYVLLHTLFYSFHNILCVLLNTLSYSFHNTLYVLLHTLSYSFRNNLYVLLPLSPYNNLTAILSALLINPSSLMQNTVTRQKSLVTPRNKQQQDNCVTCGFSLAYFSHLPLLLRTVFTVSFNSVQN
jgi:hypothetical protein